MHSHSRLIVGALMTAVSCASVAPCRAEGDWEVTPEAELAVERGLEWLARSQGPNGNWDSNDLGLVSMGTLAFLSAGHMPGRGKYGDAVEKSINYITRNAKASGLLNIADGRRDMYNHGLATFVLGQAHGMTHDPQIGRVLDRALKLIYNTQCRDGGWDYVAVRQERGHDLSLAVMQAKAIRSAVDSGLEVPPEVADLAIQSVLEHYKAANGARGITDEAKAKQGPGQFTYDGSRGTTAMAAAGVVCMQEFGRYDDWRIPKNMELISKDVLRLKGQARRNGHVPFDSYTLYYVGQALYQVGGNDWKECYPTLRDYLVESQMRNPGNPAEDGWWTDTRHVSGKPGQLYGTAVSVFVLSMPNRYLPILQEGKIEALKKELGEK
ncbi:MAG: squalene--hopene cyclase [Planctomycetaceae bacterium]|nr:squalene--hopene cyclase [Planctomycetaceae bacterium]